MWDDLRTVYGSHRYFGWVTSWSSVFDGRVIFRRLRSWKRLVYNLSTCHHLEEFKSLSSWLDFVGSCLSIYVSLVQLIQTSNLELWIRKHLLPLQNNNNLFLNILCHTRKWCRLVLIQINFSKKTKTLSLKKNFSQISWLTGTCSSHRIVLYN